jgi:hypothetical protein
MSKPPRCLIFIGLRPDATRTATERKRRSIAEVAARAPNSHCLFLSYELSGERFKYTVVFHDHTHNRSLRSPDINHLDVPGSISNFYEWVKSKGPFSSEIIWLSSTGSIEQCTSVAISLHEDVPRPIRDLVACEVPTQDDLITPGELVKALDGDVPGVLFLDACLVASIESIFSTGARWSYLVASASWLDVLDFQHESWLAHVAKTESLHDEEVCLMILSELSRQGIHCKTSGTAHESHHGIALRIDSAREFAHSYRELIGGTADTALVGRAIEASRHPFPGNTFDVICLLGWLASNSAGEFRDRTLKVLATLNDMIVGYFSVSRVLPLPRPRLLSDVTASTTPPEER